MKGHVPWKQPHAGAGEECEDEGLAEKKPLNLLQPPLPVPLCCLVEGGREVGSEVEPRKKGGMEEWWVFFRFVLISHYPPLINCL